MTKELYFYDESEMKLYVLNGGRVRIAKQLNAGEVETPPTPTGIKKYSKKRGPKKTEGFNG